MTRSDIVKELNNIKDDLRFIERTVDLIYKIQLAQGPLVEAITIIKFEKPHLYAFLKNRFDNNLALKLAFEVPVDYKHAKKSLGL